MEVEENVKVAEDVKIGFIGAGNMAKAIAFPLFNKGILNPKSVRVSGTSDRNLKYWREFGCVTSTNNRDVLENSNVIIWAVKPQMFPSACKKFQEENKPLQQQAHDHHSVLYISIMAGITLDNFEGMISTFIYGNSPFLSRTVRVMPNIGLKVGVGCAAYVMKDNKNHFDAALVESFFKSNGLCIKLDSEKQMNAYCALFGSGIGFMFPIIQAMADGAVQVGIGREIAIQIAAQVMKGAGELVHSEKLHPEVLKDSVCSPGGTTIAGIAVLEECGVRSAFIKAISASTKRGEELGALNVDKSNANDSK